MAGPPSRQSVQILGVMSDTHGDLLQTKLAVHVLEAMDIDVLLHCGDIGAPQVPTLLNQWPAHFVFGNTDRRTGMLRAEIEAAGSTCHDRFGTLTLAGRRIALLHGDQLGRLRDTIAAGQYDLVCYGHTHCFEQRRFGRTLVVNPGALHRARLPSVAVVDLATMAVTRLPVP